MELPDIIITALFVITDICLAIIVHKMRREP